MVAFSFTVQRVVPSFTVQGKGDKTNFKRTFWKTVKAIKNYYNILFITVGVCVNDGWFKHLLSLIGPWGWEGLHT